MKNPTVVRACLLVFFTCGAFPLFCRADTGLEVTSGPGTYARRDFFFSAEAPKRLRLGFDYSQYSSSYSTVAHSRYSLSAAAHPWKHVDLGVAVSFSPEAEGSKLSGFGLNGGYYRSGDIFGWSASALVTGTTYSERNDTIGGGWADLYQSSFEPRVQARFYRRVEVRAGAGTYSYSDNLDKAGRSTGKPPIATAGALPDLMDGYPENYGTVGVSVTPMRGLVVSGDWSHTAFALDQPSETAAAYGVSYLFFKAFEARGTYTIVNDAEAYTGFGCAWFW